MASYSGMSRRPQLTLKDLENMATIEEFREDPILAGELLLARDYHPLQKLALWGMWTHPFSMLDMGRGSGKCQVYKSKIITESGVRNIGDMVPTTESGEAWYDANFSVLTPHGMRKVQRVYSREKTETRKITTRWGYGVEGSAWHPVLVLDTDGVMKWKRLDGLVEGDHLCIERKRSAWGSSTDLSYAIGVEEGDERYPQELTPEFARILGYLIGDGSVSTRGTVSLTSGDDKISEDFRAFCMYATGKSPREYRKPGPKGGCVDLRLSSVQFRRYLERVGLPRCTAHNKLIPQPIFSAPKPVVAAFLQGLFDTDGYADLSGYVSLCSANRELLEQVQILLLNFGIVCALRKRAIKYNGSRNNAYEINIRSQNALRFYEEIGFSLERKQCRSEALAEKFNPNFDVIPYIEEHTKALHHMTNRFYGEGRDEAWERVRKSAQGRFNITADKLPMVLDYYREVEAGISKRLRYLEQVEELGFFYDPVVSIEKGEDYLYDLEVTPEPGDYLDHSFITNGIVSHNCVSGRTMVRVRQRKSATEPWRITTRSMAVLFEDVNQRVRIGAGAEAEWWAFPEGATEIWSWDPTGGFCWRPVLGLYKQALRADGMMEIRTADGHALQCTPQHKLLVKKGPKREWIPAKDLKLGQSVCVCTEKGEMAADVITTIAPMDDPGDAAYDVRVKDTRCYVANRIVTHNTTMASDVEYLSGLLYPGSVSLVISHSMRGVKQVFEELISTYNRSSIARAGTLDEATLGSDMAVMKFRSVGGSGKRTRINGVAPDVNKGGQGVRGQRANRCLHIDEWIFLPREVIDTSLLPCASNKENPMDEDDPNAEDLTRFIFTSSSGCTFWDSYPRMKMFREQWIAGNPKYFYLNANYEDMNRYWPGFVKENSIQMWVDTIKEPNPGAWEREIMAHWSSEAGSWYSSKSVRGNPEEKGRSDENPGGMWMHLMKDHENRTWNDGDDQVYYEASNHEGMFVLGVDPAQQQDETGFALIKVLPHRLVVMRSEGIPGLSMDQVADRIRWYMDHYNIVLVAMDPEQGGRAGVVPDLKRAKPNYINKMTGQAELFMPVYPHKKHLQPNEEVPSGARMLVKLITFSSNASHGNLTDMNLTMRLLIENRNLVVPMDVADPEDPRVSPDRFAIIKEDFETMMAQIIAVEATEIEQTSVKGKNTKNAVSSGRYNFSTKGGIKKDRYSALLIATWEANFLQQQLNSVEEEDSTQFVSMGNIFNPMMGMGPDMSMFGFDQGGYTL